MANRDIGIVMALAVVATVVGRGKRQPARSVTGAPHLPCTTPGNKRVVLQAMQRQGRSIAQNGRFSPNAGAVADGLPPAAQPWRR